LVPGETCTFARIDTLGQKDRVEAKSSTLSDLKNAFASLNHYAVVSWRPCQESQLPKGDCTFLDIVQLSRGQPEFALLVPTAMPYLPHRRVLTSLEGAVTLI
jgi:hypothetical protein